MGADANQLPRGARRAKTKAPALAVPQTDAEADALLAEYGTQARTLARYQASMDEALASVKASYEHLAEPHKTELNTLFARLQAWAEANRDRLTLGKTKTVDLPAGTLCWRIRPPSVQFKKGMKVQEIVKAVLEAGFRRKFLRMKLEVDKESMLRHPDDAVKVKGVSILRDAEDFYIEPIGLGLALAPKAEAAE